MDVYKITFQGQIDAILHTVCDIYAREIVNTNLLLDVLEQNGGNRDALSEEVNQNLVNLSTEIRGQLFVKFGYLDPNALKKD